MKRQTIALTRQTQSNGAADTPCSTRNKRVPNALKFLAHAFSLFLIHSLTVATQRDDKSFSIKRLPLPRKSRVST